jgi:NADP-dependent 3-hydroxy acid dehydrogenase YdfG
MACRNTELAEKAKQQVIANGTKSEVHIMSLDISNKESINQFVQNFQNTFKTCDILLNNAGMAYKGGIVIKSRCFWCGCS